jgi:transcriptional regulator with XRE-family HTH domain
MAMSDKEVFAANLRRLIENSPMSRRELADRAGVNYNTLGRWLKVGISKPDQRTKRSLQRICRLLHVKVSDLWADRRATDADVYAEKVKEMFDLWNKLSVDCEGVAEWIDQWYVAAKVAARFRHEEPDLTRVVAKVKALKSDGEVQTYLEGLVRDWAQGECGAYKRLIDATQRFVAAALPQDADQLSRWFVRTHSDRWARVLRSHKLDNEGELAAFVRHMMAEGLSPHEAYEGLIRLSNEPTPKKRPRKPSAVRR